MTFDLGRLRINVHFGMVTQRFFFMSAWFIALVAHCIRISCVGLHWLYTPHGCTINVVRRQVY